MSDKKYHYLFTALDKITNPIALAIIQEDLSALEAFYSQGWNINEPFYLNETYKEGIHPINLAVTGDVYEKSIRWLLEKGIDFQSIRGRSPIIYAGFACSPEIIELLVLHGADIHAIDSVGYTILKAAISGKQPANFFLMLKKLGFPVEQNKTGLLSAILDHNKALVLTLLELRTNVNQTDDQDHVFTATETPICLAAQTKQWDLVKILIQHGADVTIADKRGYRPYIYAKLDQNQEMIEYLRSLEPEEWHDPELRKDYFRSFNMPGALIEILASNQEQRHFRYHGIEECEIKEMKFHSLTTAPVFHWRKKQFIDLLCYINDYDTEGMLVWSVNHNKLASIDFEHEEFKILSVWKEPQKLFNVLNKIWK